MTKTTPLLCQNLGEFHVNQEVIVDGDRGIIVEIEWYPGLEDGFAMVSFPDLLIDFPPMCVPVGPQYITVKGVK